MDYNLIAEDATVDFGVTDTFTVAWEYGVSTTADGETVPTSIGCALFIPIRFERNRDLDLCKHWMGSINISYTRHNTH